MTVTIGAEIIREQLAADEQASFLGEVALVDGSSAVNQTGLTSRNTLFDENATCHIAYGSGIPRCSSSRSVATGCSSAA